MNPPLKLTDDKKSIDGQIVSCVNGSKYHVYTKRDGLVAVDVVSTNGTGAGKTSY